MLLRASRTRERFGVESPVVWRKKAAKPIVTSWFSVLNDHIVADSRVRSRERRPACHPFVSFLERGALSRVRARVHGRTHSRDGSRASRRTRRRPAETGRDRAVGTGTSPSAARFPVPSPSSRSWKAAPTLFAHTTPFSVDVRTRVSPLRPTSPGERRPTPRAASASPRRDARVWAPPSPRTSPPLLRYVQHLERGRASASSLTPSVRDRGFEKRNARRPGSTLRMPSNSPSREAFISTLHR